MTDVLVVDDQPAMRDLLRMVLGDAGYDVATAADARDALAYLRQATRRTIVLVDLLLPDMTGIEMLAVVTKESALARTHVYLLMTAHRRALPPPETAVLAAVSAEVVYKPFDLEVLFEAIARAESRCGAGPAR